MINILHVWASQMIEDQARKNLQRLTLKKEFNCPICGSPLVYESFKTSSLFMEIFTCDACQKVFHREDFHE